MPEPTSSALGVLEDRDRIARDLHDHVIQRLFAAGLSLQSIAATVEDEAVDQRAHAYRRRARRHDPADSHHDLRAAGGIVAIAAWHHPRGCRSALASATSPSRCTAPGPLDTIADDAIIADVEAVAAGIVDQRRQACSGRADPRLRASRQ